MEIALNGQTYTTVLAMNGARLALRKQTATLWRIASARDSIRVLAGLRRPVLISRGAT